MDDNIADITPTQDPILLARRMEKQAQEENVVAGFYMLIKADGVILRNGCAEKRMELLWALERMKQDLLR